LQTKSFTLFSKYSEVKFSDIETVQYTMITTSNYSLSIS